MRWFICCLAVLGGMSGCGPPKALSEMHAAFNRGQWSAVTEKYADLGRPRDLDGISYARVAVSAAEVYGQSKSPAYLDLAIDCYGLAAARDRSLADRHHFARGEILLLANRREEAAAAYLDALALNPHHVGAALRAAELLAGTSRAADAAHAARGLLGVLRPVNQELLDGLGALAVVEASRGRHDAAVNVLRHAAAIGPSAWGPDLLYTLARCHEARNENGPARMTLRKALTLLQENDPRRSRFDKYLEALERASHTTAGGAAPSPRPDAGNTPATREASSPTPRQAATPPPLPPGDGAEARATELAAKASALAGEGKLEEAVSLLKEAVGLAPKLPAPSAQLAALHVKRGEYADAVLVIEAAIRHNPDNVLLKQMLEKLKNALGTHSRPGG